VKPYLVSVQDKNIQAINDALNELYIEEEDFTSLRNSIDHFDSYEPLKLAQSIEKHELLEFRRVAAYIYKKNQKWAQSVELSKTDKLYKDAIETAADSKKQDVVEGLLEYFVQNGLKEAFAAGLYTCYDTVRPDVALELAWKNKLVDFAFPFLIQVLREYTTKVNTLYKEHERTRTAQEKKGEQDSFHPSQPLVGEGMYLNQIPQIAYYPTPEMGGFVPPQAFGYPPQGMPPTMPLPPGFGGFQ